MARIYFNFKFFIENSSNPKSNKVAPIDADIFKRAKSFYITSDDDIVQLAIALPLPLNETDFSEAFSSLNLNNLTPETDNEVKKVVTETSALDKLFNK